MMFRQPTMNKTHIVFVFAGDLWSVPCTGGSTIRLTRDDGSENNPMSSPDRKRILFTDKRLNVWYVDVNKGTMTKVDTNLFKNPYIVLDPEWSPDSKWIVYTKQLKNRLCAVHVYSLDTAKSTQLTDGLTDARTAAFGNDSTQCNQIKGLEFTRPR